MLIKQSPPKEPGKKRNSFLALIVSAFFFVSVVTLYSSLGTFLSSCTGPAVYVDLTCVDGGNIFASCALPYTYGSTSTPLVDFQQVRAQNWSVQLIVWAGTQPYSTYNFVTTNTNNGATIDGATIKHVAIPTKAQFRFELTIISTCSCGPNGKARYHFETGNFPADALPTNMGTVYDPIYSGC